MRYYATRAQPSYFGMIVTPVSATLPLYPYNPATPRTQFMFDFVWTSGDRLRALCVARTVEAPVACVAVEPPEGIYMRRFIPIPVDDARITSVQIGRGPQDESGDPACGNCV